MFVDPPDVKVNMEPSTPVKAQDAGNVTLICSVTSGNPSTLLRVSNYKFSFLHIKEGKQENDNNAKKNK